MANDAHTWDFFIAHASTDGPSAEALYELLTPGARVFLDSRCLELGDDWDSALKDAQRQAMISVVLVSPHTDEAYYQREEIAAAVDLARRSGRKHRVIPVYLESGLRDHDSVPYGLRLKHGLTVPDVGGMQQVAAKLLESLRRRSREESADGDDDPADDPTPDVPPFNPHAARPAQYQPQFPQQPFQPPPFQPQAMPRYVLQCVFPDQVQYFVLEDDNILAVPPNAPPVIVGRKTPPTWPGFVWMYSTPLITYGVDSAGRIWNRLPTGQPFQVGHVIHVA